MCLCVLCKSQNPDREGGREVGKELGEGVGRGVLGKGEWRGLRLWKKASMCCSHLNKLVRARTG